MRWLVWLLALAGCSSCDDVAPQLDPIPRTPGEIEPPEGLLATIWMRSGALSDLSQALEAPLLRALIPASVDELARRFDEAAHDIAPDAPVKVGLVGEWAAPRVVVGFGTDGRRVAVASDAELLAEARDWLTIEQPTLGIDVWLEDDAMAALQRTLDRAIDEQVREARRGIRREADRHEEAPAFGDPRALVDWVAQRLSSYVAFVPDIRDVRISIRFDPLEIKGFIRAIEESPADVALEEEGFTGLPYLPGGAAFAWWRASPRPGWTRLLEATAGDRLSDDDRGQVRLAETQKSDRLLLALGHEEAPYLYVRSPNASFELEPLLNVAHVRSLLGLFRCDRVVRVRLGERLCRSGPFVRFSGDSESYAFGITDRTTLGFNGPEEHVMSLVPIRASGFALIDAGRLAATSGLWRSDAPAPPARETPLTLQWEADAPELRFEVRFAPGSLAAITDAAMAATDP